MATMMTMRWPGALIAILFLLMTMLAFPAHASFKWVQEPDLDATGVSVEMTLNYFDAQ
jgi:hypothetical protein